MSDLLVEKPIDLDALLEDITNSVAKASDALRNEFTTGAFQTSPFVYTIPKMSCAIRLTLSYTREGMKGIFNRTRSKDEQEIVSTIEFDIVAAPRPT